MKEIIVLGFFSFLFAFYKNKEYSCLLRNVMKGV